MTALRSLLARLRRWLAPAPCERCGGPGCCLFLYTGVRVTEGPGGVSLGVRVNHLTPPPEWLCRACVPAAFADHAGRVRPTSAPTS